MKVLKFGGSSVGNAQRIEQVISILENYINSRKKIAVVFSAFQGVTDDLITLSNLAVNKNDSFNEHLELLFDRHYDAVDLLVNKSHRKDINKQLDAFKKELTEVLQGVYLVNELTPRTLDYIMSFGERLSCSIITSVLQSKSINAEYLDGRKLLKTDHTFGYAKVDFERTNQNIKEYFKKHKHTQIITGFIGSTNEHVTTTIGRGGSDYTASIYGAALDVEEIEIWTDVNGILTADPRTVKQAFSVNAVTYEEAMEMSHFGAKVIHPPTMLPALNKKIKIRIRNTFNPSFPGTTILEREENVKFKVKGISSIENINLLRVAGSSMTGISTITSRIFNALSRNGLNVLMITQGSSGHSICFGVRPEKGKIAKKIIDDEFRLEIQDGQIKKTIIEENLSIIAVVGEDMRNTPGIAGKVFRALGMNGISIRALAQGSSELNISLVISKDSLQKALNVLHDAVFLSKEKTLNLFMIGPGMVGSAFIDVIKERAEYIAKTQQTKFKLIGLANSKKMLFDKNGIDLDNWKEQLSASDEESDVKKYIEIMKAHDLSNSIFVDCTGQDLNAPFYNKILASSISVVTPNKVANTKKIDYYKKLRKTAAANNVQFRYATNVGAGMPIINTLKDLVSNGDEIVKMEGVLSGTLSYIFNSFKEDKKFSEIVKEAKELGFTEPDPREDLNGLDVARKLLIMIRETGEELELKDIKVENLIPRNLRKVKSVKEFIQRLPEGDSYFEKKIAKAKENGCVLGYVAKYEKGKATIAIEELSVDHPFYNLKGNDNIAAFTTRFYNDKPLVLIGKGAGAEFTASGVLADVLRISNHMG